MIAEITAIVAVKSGPVSAGAIKRSRGETTGWQSTIRDIVAAIRAGSQTLRSRRLLVNSTPGGLTNRDKQPRFERSSFRWLNPESDWRQSSKSNGISVLSFPTVT